MGMALTQKLKKKKKLTASTNPQLATGPQKCVVLGPVGELMNCMRRDEAIAVPFAKGRGRDCVRVPSASFSV